MTLVRLWVNGYGAEPVTAWIEDWDNGLFTIGNDHPFHGYLWGSAGLFSHPITVYSSKELEWSFNSMTMYPDHSKVHCVPRLSLLRSSLLSDHYLIGLWLEAERRHEGFEKCPTNCFGLIKQKMTAFLLRLRNVNKT